MFVIIIGKDRLPPSVETMEEKPASHTGDTLLNYFLTMYADGLEISWSPGVNDRETLLEAMRGKKSGGNQMPRFYTTGF